MLRKREKDEERKRPHVTPKIISCNPLSTDKITDRFRYCCKAVVFSISMNNCCGFPFKGMRYIFHYTFRRLILHACIVSEYLYYLDLFLMNAGCLKLIITSHCCLNLQSKWFHFVNMIAPIPLSRWELSVGAVWDATWIVSRESLRFIYREFEKRIIIYVSQFRLCNFFLLES